jgi:hypothetical protein
LDGHSGGAGGGIKVFLLLFLQKKKNLLFLKKEAKKLYSLCSFDREASTGGLSNFVTGTDTLGVYYFATARNGRGKNLISQAPLCKRLGRL